MEPRSTLLQHKSTQPLLEYDPLVALARSLAGSGGERCDWHLMLVALTLFSVWALLTSSFGQMHRLNSLKRGHAVFSWVINT